MEISLTALLGWLSAALALGSFFVRTMIPLRAVAMVADLIYIVYGIRTGAAPTLVLHVLLLPLNGWRLIQMRNLTFKVRSSAGGRMNLAMLLPYMSHTRFPAGTIIFRKGDDAGAVHYVISGTVQLPEFDKSVLPGELLGEMGVFTEDARRTGSAVCATDVELGTISADKFWELFFQDPAFGAYLVRTIVSRTASNVDWANSTLESAVDSRLSALGVASRAAG